MSSNIRQKFKNSRASYPFKVILYALRAPRYVASLENELDAMKNEVLTAKESAASSQSVSQTLYSETKQLDKQMGSVNDRIANINHKLLTAELSSAQSTSEGYKADTIADDHSLDNFYIAFEDKFRGSEKDIRIRLEEYLPHFKKNDIKGGSKLPIVDLGCGRGELLDLLAQNKINAIGVDMNSSMVQRAKSNGFNAVQNDAISYLVAQENNSVAAITGFHLVEHLPFGMLIKMFEECYRVVGKKGYVLFETPNPENIMVGSCNFYMDPSHLNPIPPPLLAFALETVGFDAEIIRLHPVKKKIAHRDPVVKDIAVHLYGARDYAVKAYKR